MRDVAVQDIVQGILNALHDEFGKEYTYYVNKIPQNFTEPSFYIRLIHSEFNLVIGNRYRQKNLFAISYFPKSELKISEELHSVLNRLYPVLEYIYMGKDLIRGTQQEISIDNDELHLNIHYDIFVIRPIEREPVMQVLKQNQKLKG